MAWLSRGKKSGGGAGEAAPPPPPAPEPVGPADGPPPPMGRYGPLVAITSFDQAPIELTWQLPVNGELYRLMPGPDRPDYSVMVLERPVHFYPAEGFDRERVPADRRVPDRKGRPMVRVDALVVCSRFVGQQLQPGMKDLPVNVAYVIDDAVLRDPVLDFAKIEYAAIGFLTEGHTEPLPPDDGPAAAAAETPPGNDEDRLMAEVGRVLREGVEAQRGSRVEHLTATITLDDACRVAGLTGVADGTPPVPTRETFDRLNTVLAPLRVEGGALPEVLTLTLDGAEVSWEARHRS